MRSLLVAVVIGLATVGAATSAAPTTDCRATRTTTMVNRFIVAFNRGDRAALNNQIWGGKLYFNWYSVTAEPGMRVDPDARRRNTLMKYFATRHAAGEHLALTTLKLNGVTANAYSNFEFQLLRNANDQPGGPLRYEGKGATSCVTGRLITWEMTPKH
jgi:hypothetical protein